MTPEEAAQNRQRVVVLLRDGGRCHACGTGGATEVVQVIPPEEGGTNTPTNLAPVCERCRR